MTKRLWFRNKRFGWGWTPVTWEGWLVIIAMCSLLVYVSILMEQERISQIVWVFQLVVGILILIALGYFKGPKPRWNWGNK